MNSMSHEATPRQHEKPLKHAPDKGKPIEDHGDDMRDTSDRPLLPHEMGPEMRAQVEAKLDEPLRQQAKDIVLTHLEISGDITGEWTKLVDQMTQIAELLQNMHDNERTNKGVHRIPIENAAKQQKMFRFQLEALADIRARQSLIANIADGLNPEDMLQQVKQSKDLHLDLAGTREDVAEKIGGASMLILRRAEKRILENVVEHPEHVEELRSEQKKLMDKIFKRTGGVGGTHEVSFTSAATKKRKALEAKIQDFGVRMGKVQEHIQSLSWFERTFGQGKILKKRLAEMQREQKVARMEVTAAAVGRAFGKQDRESLTKKRSDVPELTDNNVEPLENTWQLYQAELASLNSLQEKRAVLSKWPWKDRKEKARLDGLIQEKEERAMELKAQHAAEIREKNLERERDQDELGKKFGM